MLVTNKIEIVMAKASAFMHDCCVPCQIHCTLCVCVCVCMCVCMCVCVCVQGWGSVTIVT